MAEYIDRKALIGKLEKRYCVPCKEQDGDLFGDWCRFCMASNAIKEVQKTPAADVEPVVRCKNCKHYDLGVCLKIYSDGNMHTEAWQSRRPDDFCAYGEREEGAD